MANKKISELTNATTPLDGSELIPIVQNGETVKTTVLDAASVIGSPIFVPRIIYFGGTECADVNVISGEYSVNVLTAREISAPNLTTVDGAIFLYASNFLDALTTVSFPALETVSIYASSLPEFTNGSESIYINNWSSLQNIYFDSLRVVKGLIQIIGNSSITSLNLNNLEEVGEINISNNLSLTTVNISSISSLVGNCYFNSNNLNQLTVDAILAKLVSINYSNLTVDLSGGTNASPSAQGLLDKATLEANGCTVTVN